MWLWKNQYLKGGAKGLQKDNKNAGINRGHITQVKQLIVWKVIEHLLSPSSGAASFPLVLACIYCGKNRHTNTQCAVC